MSLDKNGFQLFLETDKC